MPRLRTTTALSLLVLAATIIATTWLSVAPVEMSPALSPARGPTPASRRVAAAPSTRSASPPSRSERLRPEVAPSAVVTAPVPELVPLQMRYDSTVPWAQLRGHLDGRVVAHVQVDGRGRVLAAWLVQTSGDRVLDDYALRSLRGWRFAVRADQPDGFSGELPMRFSSAATAPAASASASQDALDADAEGRHQPGDDPFR